MNGQDPVDPRVLFAAERTLLSWIRTALALMGFGFLVARFSLFIRRIDPGAGAAPGDATSIIVGAAIVCLGVIVALSAAYQYRVTIYRLRNGEALEPSAWSIATVLALIIGVFGAGIAVFLFTM